MMPYWWNISRTQWINSLDPRESGCNFRSAIFNIVLLIGIFRIYDDFRWLMPQELTDDESTLVQVMAWCRKATSHYLSQCWPTSLSPYYITRPQWWYRILASFFMEMIDQKYVCFDITVCLSEQRSPGREHDRLPQYYGQDLSSDDRKPVSCENTHQRDCIYYHEG